MPPNKVIRFRHAETTAVEPHPADVPLPKPRASSSSRLFALCLAAFVVALVGWACVGTVDVVASADGVILPVDRVKQIAAMEGGTVRAIRAADGQRVRAGAVLVELDPTVRESERDRIRNNLLMAQVAVARNRALLEPMPKALQVLALPDALEPAAAADQRDLLIAERKKHDTQLAALDQQIKQRESELRSQLILVERYRKTMPLLRERSEARRQLAEAGFGPRLTYLDAELMAIEREHQLAEAQEQLDASRATIAVLRQQREQLDAAFRQSVLSRLTEADRLTISLAQELSKAEQHVGYQRITAPVDGTVAQLAVHTLGGVVAPGAVLMTIVPEGSELEVEALVLNRDIGFIRAGQLAQVKFETFQFTMHGTMPGQVRDVATDSVRNDLLGFVYPTRIKLARPSMSIDGRETPLAAGMKVTVDIVTDERRVIEFILSPLLRMRHDGMRQR